MEGTRYSQEKILDQIMEHCHPATKRRSRNSAFHMDVEIRKSKKGAEARYTIRFYNDSWKVFGNERVVPVFNDKASVIYFLKESKASKYGYGEGYTLSQESNSKARKINLPHEEFSSFIGDYPLMFLKDAGIYYIEK